MHIEHHRTAKSDVAYCAPNKGSIFQVGLEDAAFKAQTPRMSLAHDIR